ncbi:MAG: AMP-binding protein, partial [Oligoflexus sp.]
MSVDRTAPEPLDRSQTIDKNLLDYMREAVARYANRPAYSQRGQTLSFQEIDRLSERFAAFLQNHPQLKSGDRIAVQLPNVLSYPLVAFGILKAGMVLVNVNPLYTDYETLKQLRDADIKGWICIETSAHLISTVRQELDIPLVMISGVFDLHDFPKRHLYSYILRRHLHLVKPYDAKDTIPLRQALRVGRSQTWHRPALGPHDLAMIQYTGGSTGVLKGAMLTHGNIVANMEQVSCFLGSEVQLGSEVVIAPLPIYHIFSFTVHCVTPLITGSHNVLIVDPTQIHALIREMKRWS